MSTAPVKIDEDQIQQDFEDFYEEVFTELAKVCAALRARGAIHDVRSSARWRSSW